MPLAFFNEQTPIAKFSMYVAAATRIESPERANETEWRMVLQAVVGDLQSLLSLPVVPLTYQVVLARAAGARGRNSPIKRVAQMGLILGLRSEEFLTGPKSSLRWNLPDSNVPMEERI